MSGRKLGGGRILGSGKGLAPPSPSPSASASASPSSAAAAHLDDRHHHHHHQTHPPRAASPFAPSESSTVSRRSLNSPLHSPSLSSPSPLAVDQDLAAHISLAHPAADPGASANRLVCPICEEEMVTLLQLNRHLDDAHQELPAAEQDEVKSWFDKQVRKARRFQPLSLINQKLRGLDVFESNESPLPPSVLAAAAAAAAGGGGAAGEGEGAGAGAAAPLSRPLDAAVDPEELVTRKHWQRPTGHDVCTDPLCGRRLGPLSGGAVHCRKCGRLFCEEHTLYQMKLSPAARHDPVRGVWCRVCETCYKARDGYNDHDGLLRDHTAAFVAARTRRVDRQNLETARLEKRLTKLTRLLVDPPDDVPPAPSPPPAVASALPLPLPRNPRKAIEQAVVAWEDDASVARCPFCRQEFGSWTFRRHHCRLCGRVVCADPQTGCSSEVGLDVANPTSPPASEKPGAPLSLDIRMCRACKTTLFAKRDFAASVAYKPPDQRAYETLRQFEHGIRQLLPAFQRALQTLQPDWDDAHDTHPLHRKSSNHHDNASSTSLSSARPPPTHAQIQEAAKLRKRLLDSFAKYDLAARRLRDLQTDSPTQRKLQKAVYAAASAFLHRYMLPLKSVPRLLGSTTGAPSSHHRRLLARAGAGAGAGGAHSPLRNGALAASSSASTLGGTGSDAETASLGGAREASTAALESEEREVRERLVVLEEQRFLVQQMVSSARGARRFEEVGALTRNLEELDQEIAGLRRRVSGVEERWEGLYAGAAAGAAAGER